MPQIKNVKFIFTIGGVLSGLGKGVTTASVGLLLKSKGYCVTAIKIDPYISIDAGTMRPAEHGEVFVTDDGGEIDQDLGNYERFLNQSLTKHHNITTGKVYQNVIHNERHFKYKGRDAQLFPDVINEIKRLILKPIKNEDFCLVEIGGTTGDLENLPFLHAIRELGREYKSIYILVTYLPYLKNIGELKTKPTQHAVTNLRSTGIFPDFIITRNEIPIDKPRIETIAKRTFLDEENIIDNPDTDSIYKIPQRLNQAKFAEKILKKFNLKSKANQFQNWTNTTKRLIQAKKTVNILLVGKYVIHGVAKHKDVYISVYESIYHAAAKLSLKPNIVAIDSSQIEKEGLQILNQYKPHGIILPQGWGSRGVEGKISATQFARENKIPYLGLCFGMQLATVEFARNVLNLKNANSQEINPKTPYSVIHIMPDQAKYLKKHQYGGTIRLGAWPAIVKLNTLLGESYKKYGTDDNLIKKQRISERHRHRYEVNQQYLSKLESKGYIVSAISPDKKLVEAMEYDPKTHPFFVGVQFHPEYKSRVLSPHPIFVSFLEHALKYKHN